MSVIDFVNKNYRDRSGTYAQKFTVLKNRFGSDDLISMWVADMEFQTSRPIIDSLIQRVEHGIFGYSDAPGGYFEAYTQWMKSHYDQSVNKEDIRVSPGVVPALYWFINMYTQNGDAVIIMPPVYYPFKNSIRDNNRKVIECDLLYDEGKFSINFKAFEKQIIENDAKLFLLCSPHNPVGRVWNEEELDRMLGICLKHNVIVVADEIHQDITMPGVRFIPATKVSGGKYQSIIITANAPSKTFNLAGMNHANVIISNPKLMEIYDNFCNRYYHVEFNILGFTACEAAYRYGDPWRQVLLELVYEQYLYVKDEMREFPQIVIAPMEGTYLVFMELGAIVPEQEIKTFMQEKCRIACDYGDWFGENWGRFIRLNIATHPDFVKEAIQNIKRELRKYTGGSL